jgi:NADH:ubiquinone reductase (H+-translocating)
MAMVGVLVATLTDLRVADQGGAPMYGCARGRMLSVCLPTCQHALRQARRLARNLTGTARPYAYRTRGQMATLGRRHGIALVGRAPVAGLPGWLFARAYHLAQLPLRARRVRVVSDWLTAAFFRRDIAELSAPA